MPVMRAARAQRQVYMNQRSHIVVSSPKLDKILYTIEPVLDENGTPTIVVKDGAGTTVMTISVTALRLVLRYLPVVINAATRMARRTTTTTLPKRATLIDDAEQSTNTTQED